VAFAGVSYLAILVAAVASWPFGAVWYMTLAKPWMAAQGYASKAEMLGPGGKPSPLPFVIAFVAELVMAWVLAGIIGHMGQVTVRTGLITGFFAWLGFALTTMTVNYAYSRHKPVLAVIDGGHWLGVLLIQGLVIGLFGVS
jgi:Protein of unknown function (DUF1761)